MTAKILIDRKLLVRVQDVLSRWSEIINYQCCGSMEAMTYLQVADDMSQPVLNEVSAILDAPQQEAVAWYCDAHGYTDNKDDAESWLDRGMPVTEYYLHPAPQHQEAVAWFDNSGKLHGRVSSEQLEQLCREGIAQVACSAPSVPDDRKDAEPWKERLRRIYDTLPDEAKKFYGKHGFAAYCAALDAEINAAMAAQKGEKE